MNKIINGLKGYKTYLGIGAGVLYSVLIYQGIVASNELVWTAIVGFTGVSFRLAVK